MRLDNAELALEQARLIGQRDRQVERLRLLEQLRVAQPEMQDQIPAAKEAIADYERQLAEHAKRLAQLELRADRAGVVLPPPAQLAKAAEPGQVPPWRGTPLDPWNRGLHLPTGQLAALVGDPAQLEVVLEISQEDVDLVTAGQAVRLTLDQAPGQVLAGRVLEIAQAQLALPPRDERSASAATAAAPTIVKYEALVAIDPPAPPLVAGSRGRGYVRVASEPLGPRLVKALRRVFAAPR